MQFFSASNLFHFFWRDILWNWLTIIVSSKQEGVEFDSNPGQAAVSWCESECDCFFVSLWPCDKLSTCRGCNPTFPLRRLGEAPATPECRTNNRKWMEGLFFSFINIQRWVCDNLWQHLIHFFSSRHFCSWLQQVHEGTKGQLTQTRNTPARQPATRSSAVISRPRGSPCMFYSRLQQQ